MPNPIDDLIDSFEFVGTILLSKTVPASINKSKSIGLLRFFIIGLCKSKFTETIFFPPTYDVLEFLGPTP